MKNESDGILLDAAGLFGEQREILVVKRPNRRTPRMIDIDQLMETLEAAEVSGRVRGSGDPEARQVIVDTVRALVEVEYLRQNGKSGEFQKAVMEALRRREEEGEW